MREIKFRAWDKRTSQMYEYDYLVEAGRQLVIFAKRMRPNIPDMENAKGGLMLFTDDEDMELMQFTGRKDIRGVDIYEGDILRYYSDARMYVLVSEGRWGVEGNPHLEERTVVEWSDELGSYVVHGGMYFHEINEKSEVIGNIYENPELMEGWRTR